MKVALIQESKLSSNSRTPIIHNFSTVRKDRRQYQGGGLITLIHKSINFSRRPESPESTSLGRIDHYGHAGRHGVDHYQRLHTPTSSCAEGCLPSLDHLIIILGDFNAHHSSWCSSSTNTRGNILDSIISGSNFGILNWDSPTRVPSNANPSPDVSLASSSFITYTNRQTKTDLGSNHLPILISLLMDSTINPISHQLQFTEGQLGQIS